MAWTGTLACSSQPPPARSLAGDDGWQTTSTPLGAGRRSPSGRARAIPPDDRKPWPGLGRLAQMTAAGARGPSDHLGGGYERTVRINAAARGYLERGSREPLPAGAVIVQLHHRPGQDATETAFVMEKRAAGHAPQRGDWDYLVLDEQWRIESRRMETCVRCHLAAPRDSLFGPCLDRERPAP